ncbi:MAG: AsmA family protein [Burkholderiaceae bacterium]
MSVWFPRILIALAALVALMAALAIWLVTSFEPDRYKGVAIDWMKTHHNRTLSIDGPIELSVFPRLELRLSKISLSEAGKSDEFAALDEADLAVEVLPLLRGRVAVDRVHARGVSVALLRDAKGKRNIDDLAEPGNTVAGATQASPAASAAPAGPAAAPTEPSVPAIALDVRSIRLADVRARIKDDAAGVHGEVLLKELSMGRIASRVATPVKLVVQLGLKAPALKGELRGSCEVTPDLQTGSVLLTDMDLAYKGDAPSASNIDATVKGSLAYDAANGAIEAKSLELRISANTGALKLVDSSLNIARFTHDPGQRQIAVDQLKLRVSGTQGGQPLALSLDWAELDVSGTTLKGSPLSGALTLAGEVPIEARFTSGAPSGSFDILRIPSFEARVSSNAPARKLDATLRTDLVMQPEKQSIAFDKLGLDLKLNDPGLKPLALTLQGQADASAQSAHWNLAGQFNTNAFRTEGTANLAATTPNVRASLRFEDLDLNAVLPTPPPAAPAPGGAAARSQDASVDLSALRSVNGSFTLRAASVAVRQYRVADLVVQASLETGVLRVSTLQGKAWGGALDASVIADARASRVAVKATANAVDVNALLKDVAHTDLLDGKGRVIADLDSAGRSVSEMKSRLKGSASLQVRDGALKGYNLAASLRQAKAALSTRRDAAQRASQAEKTDFTEMSASFQIDSGIARSNDLDMKSPYLRIGGEGSIDVGKDRIDYTARATVTDTSKGQGGSDLAALRGLTIPLKLSGPFDAIDWNVQWSAVALGAMKNQLKGKLEEGLRPGAASAPASREQLKEKAQDMVKDKLKGLFK